MDQQTPNEEPSEQPKKATPKTIGKRTSYASRVAPPNRALAILGRIGGVVGMLALMAGIIAFFVFMFSDRPEKPSGIPAAPKNATNTKLPGYLCGSWAEIGYMFTGDDSITPDFKEIGSASPSSIRLIVNLSSRRQNSMNDELVISKVHGGESGSGVDVVIQFSNSAYSMQVSSLSAALKNPEKFTGKYALRLYDNNTGKEVSRWLLSVTPSQTSKLYYPDNRLPGDSDGVFDAGSNKWTVIRNGESVSLDGWHP